MNNNDDNLLFFLFALIAILYLMAQYLDMI